MGINKKIAKIPFAVLYGILFFFTLWDFGFTYASITTNPRAYESNPLHAFFVGLVGPQYFIYLFPVALLILYFGCKLGGRLVTRFENEIRGDNHIALALILVWTPNILNQGFQFLFGTRLLGKAGFKLLYPVGLIILAAYLIITEYDLWKIKNKK